MAVTQEMIIVQSHIDDGGHTQEMIIVQSHIDDGGHTQEMIIVQSHIDDGGHTQEMFIVQSHTDDGGHTGNDHCSVSRIDTHEYLKWTPTKLKSLTDATGGGDSSVVRAPDS